jgi:hypothetical protein
MAYGDSVYGDGIGTSVALGNYRPTTVPLTDAYVQLDNWLAPALDSEGTEWILTAVEGWNGTAAVRTSLADRPQDHGSFDGPSFYGTRVITLEGSAISTSRSAAMKAQDILASVAAEQTASLYTLLVAEPGQPSRCAYVRLNGGTKIGTIHGGQSFDWNLQLIAPDHRRYADTETILTLELATSGGTSTGLTAPFTAPFLTTGSAASTTTKTAYNIGTASTRPVVTFFGPLTNPGITNLNVGKTLSFTYDLLAGQTLVVDFDARTALLNGTASRTYAITPTAAYWDIAPGGNDIRFTALGGNGNAEVRFRSAWH